jgi:hypothetical protein
MTVVDHVVVDSVRETMFDPAESDHSFAAMGEVAKTPCDVVANLNLHCGLAEVEIAAILQFKTHRALHESVSRSLCHDVR